MNGRLKVCGADEGRPKSVQIQGIVKIYRGPFETSCPTFVGYAVLV